MKIEEIFYQTKIWNHFDSVANDSQKELLKELVRHAIPLLDRIIETFPTYTLHNGQHQLNILNLYSNLLGSKMSNLSGLETAILILSAFYHDIGMVYKGSDKENIAKEELFSLFLTKNPSAQLLFEEDISLSEELIEWYCRWAHAKRIWIYLNQINHMLTWENNNFRKELAHVCLSHNENVKYIESDYISSDFWNSADLKFCAILLRLADILDFDESRSPESVFNYLGLNNPKTQSAKVSHKEWCKHLASNGFDFKNWSDNSSYTITFKASPDHPAVENDIREFLDIIENELQQCRSLLRNCSSKWRDFIIPDKIDRTKIYSQGYTSGSFKFSLDQKQVLHLLMGDSLYQNSFVFLRELLQNSIDTTRHRERHEKYILKSKHAVKPVEITTWYDKSGYKWIRVDDYGMGMTIDQIQKYFLKVGNSFYNSDEFKVSKINYPLEEKCFTPVSKFGIGILSCFMIGDLIEVSTKSVYCDNNKTHPIRLTLKGIDNYYFLYTGDDMPCEMPNKLKSEKLYRKEIGTSIAIRLNPNYDRKEFEIHNLLENLVHSSFTPIIYRSAEYGTESIDRLSTNIVKYKIPKHDIDRIKIYLKDSRIKEINPEIHRIPIKLIDERIPDVKGILYIFLLRMNVTYSQGNLRSSTDEYYGFHRDHRFHNGNEFSLKYSAYNESNPNLILRIINKNSRKHNRFLEISLNNLLEDIKEFNGSIKLNHLRDEILLTHNGIIIPNNPDYYENGTKLEFKIKELDSDSTLSLGIVNLKDNLRPNLNVARDKIISFTWNCLSQINFLVRTCLDKSNYNFKSEIDYTTYFIKYQSDNNEVDSDMLLNNVHYWPNIVEINEKGLTVGSLIENQTIEAPLLTRSNSDFEELIEIKSIFNHCNYSIKLFKNKKEKAGEKDTENVLIKKAFITKKHNNNYNNASFPSHFVCEYENFSGLMPYKLNLQLYNINHPFTRWLMMCYKELLEKYPFYLRSIFQAESIEYLNSSLDKLRTLLPEDLKPEIIITEKDFEIDFNTLEELES